jgi:hypothetical protein
MNDVFVCIKNIAFVCIYMQLSKPVKNKNMIKIQCSMADPNRIIDITDNKVFICVGKMAYGI